MNYTKKILLSVSLAATLIASAVVPALGQVSSALTCTPSTSVVAPGANVNLLVTGGNGTYTFSGASIVTATTTSTSFPVSFAAVGNNTVTVSSNGQTSNCNVNAQLTAGAASSTVLTCATPLNTVFVGQPATFTAQGGALGATLAWSASDLTLNNPTGSGFTVNYATPGIHMVSVSSSGQSATCAVSVQPAAVTGTSPTLCTPATQTVMAGAQASFTASGGNGSYIWSASDLTLVNPVGSGFSASYAGAGLHTVTVSSGGTSSSCQVNVLSATTPSLPNTGFAPTY
jgi:hypothetical protein